MDYGRMGAAKIGSNKPRHTDRDAKGAPNKVSDAQRDQKAALLERMKAAAAAAKSGSKPQ